MKKALILVIIIMIYNNIFSQINVIKTQYGGVFGRLKTDSILILSTISDTNRYRILGAIFLDTNSGNLYMYKKGGYGVPINNQTISIGTPSNGLSLLGNVLTQGVSSGGSTGALSSIDWNVFNNKQNALTNPITGTGTINTIPKFTGGTTIGNSNLVDNGTNITSNKQINVNDTFVSLSSLAGYNFNTNLRFYGNFNPSTGDNGARRVADIFAGFSNKTGGYTWGNEYMSFNVGNNGQPNDNSLPTKEIMRLTNTGLGIGTTNPSTFLDIYNSNTNIPNINLTYNNTSKGGLGWGSSIGFNVPTTSGGNNKFPLAIIKGSPYNNINGDSTGAILFLTYQNGTGNYNIPLSLTGENGGKAGIGVSFPTEKLDIGGTIKQMNCINGMVKADGTGRLVCATPNVDYVKPVLASPPAIPITCTAGDHNINVSWVSPNDTFQILGYNLTNITTFTDIFINKFNNNYSLTGLTNGNLYNLQFYAFNVRGQGVLSTCSATPTNPAPSANVITGTTTLTVGLGENHNSGNGTITAGSSFPIKINASFIIPLSGSGCSVTGNVLIYNSSGVQVSNLTIAGTYPPQQVTGGASSLTTLSPGNYTYSISANFTNGGCVDDINQNAFNATVTFTQQ